MTIDGGLPEAAQEPVELPTPDLGEAVEERAGAGPTAAGWIARRAVLAVVVALVIFSPSLVPSNQARWVSLAFIYVIIGLSVNILMGYAGQISLGHDAFVGVGAFTSALIVSKANQPFLIALVVSGATGAVSAILLGFVALRLKGLYLALITLAYGAIATGSIFATSAITGGGAGAEAPPPPGFTTDRAYAYLCLIVLAALYYVDWRLVKSKVGRAIFAIRENELAAASFGISVTGYKLLAFVLSGIFAGIAGSLFAHRTTVVVSSDFSFALALTFVLMVVVGGLGSRIGVFIGSAFFAVLRLLLDLLFGAVKALEDVPFINTFPDHPEFLGAILLLLTLTLFPGGIAQQIQPIVGWFGGKPIRGHGRTQEIQTGGAGVRP
jgi:branched-chain amino acid transport system permease protein